MIIYLEKAVIKLKTTSSILTNVMFIDVWDFKNFNFPFLFMDITSVITGYIQRQTTIHNVRDLVRNYRKICIYVGCLKYFCASRA